MIRFFDASALVKRYVREKGSETVERLLAAGRPSMSRLSEAEIASALARRARLGDCSVRERDRMLVAMENDRASFLIVEVVPAVTARARGLLNAYALRASDAIQLASCLHLRARLDRDVPFVAYDERLAAVARGTGATVLGVADPPDRGIDGH